MSEVPTQRNVLKSANDITQALKKDRMSSCGNFASKFQPGIDQFSDTIHFKNKKMTLVMLLMYSSKV